MQNLWVLLKLVGNVYAISCQSVLSLFQVNEITPLPAFSKEVKGVIKYQGKIIQLIDIKRIFNLKPTEEDLEEFKQLMQMRKQDHINWLTTLENSVMNNVEFTLITDPHKCAFGKWYDSYDSNQTNNIMFMTTFARFDTPHKAIHEIGNKAKELIEKNNRQGAIDLIKEAKNKELSQMMHLFEELNSAYAESKREVVVVFGDEKDMISLVADEIVSIEELGEVDNDLLEETVGCSDFLRGIAKRKDGQPIFVLDHEYLMNRFLSKELVWFIARID